MGKSTLLLDICRHAAIDGGKTVALFSLEMSRREIIARLLCAQARVPLFSAQHQTLTDADLHRLSRVMADVAEAPLLIDDTPGLSLPQIRAALMKHVRSGRPLHLAAIDYAQLVTPTGRSTSRNREQEVSEMSRGIKLLGKEFGIPVILCAQLNRGPEQRADKRPVLADLRESGSIEQDADIVILLFREDAYERESPNAGVCDFIVAKHRNGPTAVLQVASQLHYARFADMARI
jgi:replicative DNA helicase